MRRASHSIFVIMAAVIATGASAGAANQVVQKMPQPVLRTASGGTAALPSKPALRATAASMPMAKRVAVPKVVMAQPVVKKVVVVSHTHATHKHFAMRRAAPAITVPMDEVRVVAFSQPISTIYVGNPIIADVSMIDNKHAFVLGKSFGATNIVALNADGKQVVNDAVSVYGRSSNTVILHRGTAQATYACAGARCESAPMPGDDKDSFDSRMGQINTHQDAGIKAASASH
jgi:hypothetical protein